jgi:aerobic-type carbon monoxide dehydrogenase small subunit (CoxS/CutS family)
MADQSYKCVDIPAMPEGTDLTTLEGLKLFRLAEARAFATAFLEQSVPLHKQRNAALGIRMKDGEAEQIKSKIIAVATRCDEYEAMIEAATTLEALEAINIEY